LILPVLRVGETVPLGGGRREKFSNKLSVKKEL